jgi:hypothetical protein
MKQGVTAGWDSLAVTETVSDVYSRSLTLSRRRLLQGAVSLAAYSLLPGCGGSSNHADNTSSPAAVSFSTGPVVQGSLMVTTNAIGAIPAHFMGLSYEKITMSYSYFHSSNSDLIALFRLLGNGVLRIGGGSVDQVQWMATGSGTHMQVTPANIKALAGFLQATGWRCLYGVNFATSTPALAAEEAAYAVATLGPSLLGIEIGNEPDEYGIAGSFFAGNWTFQDFLARWDLFRAAIIQAAPHTPFTGPVTGGGNHITGWTLPFGSVTQNKITLLTQHYYRANGASPGSTASLLISPDTQLSADLKTLNAGAEQLGIPYRIGECNSFYGGGAAGVSDSYASSLWVIDFLFSAALGGATGVNMHGGGNGPGYTPISDDSGGVIEARPEYYGLLFFSLAGPGTLLATQLSVGSVDATAYAVRSASGGLNVIVVNKETQNLTLALETNRSIRAATLQLMTGPGLAATSGVTIQGATVNKDGSFAPAKPGNLRLDGTQTTCSIPALSAGLISIT